MAGFGESRQASTAGDHGMWCGHVLDRGMFAGADVQHPGIVFPLLDSLRSSRHRAGRGVRQLFVRIKFEQELSPLILVYPCLALFFTFSIWLLFFS